VIRDLSAATPQSPNPLILSVARTSRSEALPESKDPAHLNRPSQMFRKTAASVSIARWLA